eukprot:gnl/MRDRNA2_/MRDRNA2_113855_c0_seq1.p1 gnl/MRDRNA2_/MRDRNA2_113855_c0~~gnl/MRDRNA2_/MRDRNA2_113855_c0_seq1.p1  ORF type:complete len:433 (-),score=124.71 gnl/MRDRNA2_/MRDRNA2_113855_c0_seq1:9-1307(-)
MWLQGSVVQITLLLLRVGRGSDHGLSSTGSLQRDSDSDDLPTCTCDCCNTVQRRVDEVFMGVEIKCAPSSIRGPDLCPEQCTADETDKVLPTGDDFLDYMRFCFFECKPVNGLQTPLEAECTPLTNDDLKYVMDATGNAHDPAIALVRQAQAAAQAAMQKHATLLARNQKADPKLAKLHAENAIKTATFEGGAARDLSQETRSMEEEKALGRHEVLSKQIEDFKNEPPQDSVIQVHEAMMAAGEAARKAGIAAQSSLETLKNARQVAWETAVDEGENEMKAVKAGQDAFGAGLGAHAAGFANALDFKMLMAAKKAAEPYFLGFLRAKQQMASYESQAAKMAAKANKWKADANAETEKANKLFAEGDHEFAQKVIKKAQDLMARAKEYAGQAKHFLATAEEVNKGLPDYMAASRSAAARAAWELQPAWPGKRV